MSDKPKQTTKDTTTSKTPLGEQAPIFSNIWNKTAGAVQDFTPFGGNVVAAPNTYQQQGVSSLYDAAGNVGQNFTNSADMAKKVASGYFLDPTNDPTFQGAVNSAINPITRQLQETVLPGIVDRSIKVGGTGSGPSAYGGSSQDLQENQAVQNWAKQASDTTASMANASRTAGLDLIKAIPQLNAGVNNEALAQSGVINTAGGLQNQQDQAVLDNELQKWQLNQQTFLPFLQQAASILNTGGFGNGTSNTTETGPAPDMATQWLQGLTGGAGMANSLFGAAKGGTSAMSGLTSALSGLAMFSDRRLKSHIREWGRAANGVMLYLFKYLGFGPEYLGPMADEVPHACSDFYGYKLVNYARAVGA